MGEVSTKTRISSNWSSQPITRSDTILNRITYDYEPGEGMIKNEEIQKQILNSLANKPRRILTREMYLTIFKGLEVQEPEETKKGTSPNLSDMDTNVSQVSKSPNLASADSSFKSLSEISSRPLESENLSISNRSPPNHSDNKNNYSIQDTSFKQGVSVKNKRAFFQLPEKEVIRHSTSNIFNGWIENALDVVMPYIP